MGEHTRAMYVDRLDRLFDRLDRARFLTGDEGAEQAALAFVSSLSGAEAADLVGAAARGCCEHLLERRDELVAMLELRLNPPKP